MVQIVVVGSINCDLTVKVRTLPRPGETILGHGGRFSIGGKGLNQAIAASRAGACVHMIGRIGDDQFGGLASQYLDRQAINASAVTIDPGASTGTAIIALADDGQNMIAVAPAANSCVSAADIANASGVIDEAAIVMAQLEIPLATIQCAFDLARANGVATILNPAPANPAAFGLLSLADIVTPNETELASLSGIEYDGTDAMLLSAMQLLVDRGARQVVVTLGGDGCAAWDGATFHRLPAFAVDAVDTTGAGDVFNGVLAVGVAEGLPIEDAMWRASAAAAISVMHETADAAPDRAGIDAFLAGHRETWRRDPSADALS